MTDLLCPDFIYQCIENTGVATIRKHRIPLDMAVWTVIAMSLYRQEPVWSIVGKAQLMLPGKNALVAPSAVVQARQRLGVDAVKEVFHQSQKMWHQQAEHPQWSGLTLLALIVLCGEPQIQMKTEKRLSHHRITMVIMLFP